MLLLQEPIWIFDLFGLLYEVIGLPMLYRKDEVRSNSFLQCYHDYKHETVS